MSSSSRPDGPRARSATAKQVQIEPGVRVNLGCGDDVREGWVNVDQHRPRELPPEVRFRDSGEGLVTAKRGDPVFVQADILDYLLDLAKNVVGEILLDNVLEHLDRPLIVLREIARVCRPGAPVTVRVPHENAPGANLLTHTWLFSTESLRPVLTDEGGLENTQLFEIVDRQVFRAFPGAWLLRDLTGLTLPFGRRQAIEWRLKVI